MSKGFRRSHVLLICCEYSAGIFTISVWNGASYYVEVFGRRFEKELVSLRRELEDLRSTEQAIAQDKTHHATTANASATEQLHSKDAQDAEELADSISPTDMPITASQDEKKAQ